MKPDRLLVVAIDGPAGVGKSTLARRLAEALGLAYLNTGAMYRALAREALRTGTDVGDGPALAELARTLRFSINKGTPSSLLIDGRPADDDLATAEVEAVVSLVARHPEVREVLRAEQRRLGSQGAVVEGRDIGTVVFPDADLKVFLEADPVERAARRRAQRDAAPETAEALARRDALDSVTNPFVPAKDALVVDTSGKEADEVFQEVMAAVRRLRAGERG
ncbi:MAG: (d)CMP kinase [Actinomycetota bacterium]